MCNQLSPRQIQNRFSFSYTKVSTLSLFQQ
uniref:Uncharacterized protein n=1 Tax=Anguilla anguilla TaxID=7936 RepID=A0A0E9PHJ6_ANGAN